MTLCVAGDVDPDEIYAIADEILSKDCAEIPKTDYGEAESEYPLEKYHEERMEVSAPQFLIGAKLRPENDGRALLRQKIVSQLALRTVLGSSSDFYIRLYGEGILNRDYEYECDFTAGTATFMLGGESPDPQRVLKEFNALVAEVAKNGIDKEAFTRSKNASFGSRLRGLEDFDNICIALVEGSFNGYCSLDSFEILSSIDIGECERFITESLSPDKLAMSVILPVKQGE